MTPPPRYQLPNPNPNPGLDLMRYRGTVKDMRHTVDAQFTGTASGPRPFMAMRGGGRQRRRNDTPLMIRRQGGGIDAAGGMAGGR